MQLSVDEGFCIAGISTRTSNAPGKGEKDIPSLWGKFMGEGWPGKIPGRADDTVYSVYTNYESDFTGEYDVILGCRVNGIPDSLPEGLTSVLVNAGPFEKFTANGNLMKGVVFTEWQKIWNSGLSRSYTADFEVYDERSTDPAHAAVDIFIALNPS